MLALCVNATMSYLTMPLCSASVSKHVQVHSCGILVGVVAGLGDYVMNCIICEH